MWRQLEGPVALKATALRCSQSRASSCTPGAAMKLNLATRLFAAVLSTAVVVAVAMGVGAHLNRGDPGRGGCGDEPCPEAEGGEELGVLYHREPGVNFTNILPEDFTHADPKSGKKLMT